MSNAWKQLCSISSLVFRKKLMPTPHFLLQGVNKKMVVAEK